MNLARRKLITYAGIDFTALPRFVPYFSFTFSSTLGGHADGWGIEDQSIQTYLIMRSNVSKTVEERETDRGIKTYALLKRSFHFSAFTTWLVLYINV